MQYKNNQQNSKALKLVLYSSTFKDIQVLYEPCVPYDCNENVDMRSGQSSQRWLDSKRILNSFYNINLWIKVTNYRHLAEGLAILNINWCKQRTWQQPLLSVKIYCIIQNIIWFYALKILPAIKYEPKNAKRAFSSMFPYITMVVILHRSMVYTSLLALEDKDMVIVKGYEERIRFLLQPVTSSSISCHESIFTKTLGLENIFNAFSISLSLFSSSIFLCFIRSVSQLTGRELSSVVISFCSKRRLSL